MPDQPQPTTPGDGPSINRRRLRRPRFLALAALLIGTGVVAGATDTPEVWAVPGAILIAAMWIRRRPRRIEVRAGLSAAIVLSVAGAVLVSPAVLLAWPAFALARLVRRRGLRAARIPLAVAAGVTALAFAAAALGLPVGIAFVAFFPLVVIARHRPGGHHHYPRASA
jgi:FtsH-binding integral membrane protein